MRRWEKEVLKSIRSEAASALQTPGTSIGGREPELNRALYQLSAEHGCGEENRSLRPTAGKVLSDGGGEEEAALAAAHEEGERVARAEEQPAIGTREDSGDGKGQPATVDGDAAATLEQQSGETGLIARKTAAATGAGMDCTDVAVASDVSEEENQAAEEQQGDDAIKDMVKKLLRTSSSVALAVARPLSIRPPPVLEVEQDLHQVNSFLSARWQVRPFHGSEVPILIAV